MDEAILCYKGKVNEWKQWRMGFYLIRASLVEKPGDIESIWPLPFDGKVKDNTDDLIRQYNLLKESGALDG